MTACSADADDPSAVDSNTSNGPASLSITTLGLCNEVAVYWAQEKGVFADHGLDVDFVRVQGGAAGLSALQSGEVDVTFIDPFVTMRAIDQGIDLKWVATAYETPTDPNNAMNSVAVKNGSAFTDAKSLEGKTIGVNEIAGINQIITSEWMRVNGADPSTVEFVALPFPDLAPAVATGRIDAAQITEANMLPELDLVSLGNPYVAAGGGESLVFAGYVAAANDAEHRPEVFRSFQAALVDSVQQIGESGNEDARLAVESAACKRDVEALKALTAPPYIATVNMAALDRNAELLKREGLLENPPPASSYVPEFVVTSG
ncbi:ABC transporter substrate-binding protein [Rhodococcus sp. NPDC060084]|uniref:ABC transporter substrate-binding protein n=1 Tax=Rhodococcus sp. NPDC060084 TaxID=3347053 RepID=UPI0036662878